MGSTSIHERITFLDTRQSPLGLAPVYRLQRPPHSFIQKIAIPKFCQREEVQRLKKYKEIESDSLCQIYALQKQEGIIQVCSDQISVYCLYLPINLRKHLANQDIRLDNGKLSYLMQQLTGLGIQLTKLGRQKILQPNQISLDEIYVDITGQIKLHPFSSTKQFKDILPSVENLGIFKIKNQNEMTDQGFVWSAGMIALQICCKIDSQLIFYDQSKNQIQFHKIQQALYQISQFYSQPIIKLIGKMLKKKDRIILPRCHQAWQTLTNSKQLSTSSLTLFGQQKRITKTNSSFGFKY